MNNKYDSIINKLRKSLPNPALPDELTSKIMRGIETAGKRKQLHLTISLSERQWGLFKSIRTAMAAAAIFIAGFFVYQQREMNEKLDLLETKIAASGNYEQLQYMETSRQAKYQQLFEARFASTTGYTPENNEEIMINRKTLNFFLSTIRELEQENAGYQNKFRKLAADSVKFNPTFQNFK
jgi:hypothetical protein